MVNTLYTGAKDISDLRQFHEFNNLLSYQSTAPPDIRVLLEQPSTLVFGGNLKKCSIFFLIIIVGIAQNYQVSQSTLSQQQQTSETDISISAGLGIDTVTNLQVSAEPLGVGVAVSRDIGVRAGVQAGYNTSRLKTTNFAFETSTNLIVNWQNTGTSQQSYRVTPYFYFATTGFFSHLII
jgi:hypothetical protein